MTGSGASFLGALVDELSKVLPQRDQQGIDPEIEREIEQFLKSGEAGSTLRLEGDRGPPVRSSTT